MVLGEFDPEKQEHRLGKLTLFMGIREYPSRTKCASLAWHTMVGALDKKTEGVSTERKNGHSGKFYSNQKPARL